MLTTFSVPAALRRVLLHSACACASYKGAAAALDKGGYHVVAHAFAFTARQEAEHAALLAGLLGQMPVTLPPLPMAAADAKKLLGRAARRETACAEVLFPAAWQEAEALGHHRLAEALRRMADTEKTHARRFRQYLTALSDGSLTYDNSLAGWLCLPCGCLHYGRTAPERCDGCGCGPGHFIRSDFYPFAVGE